MAQHLDFISKEEEAEIITAIEQAENATSGEIRVHIEKTSDKTPIERAKEVFNSLEMYKTKDRNGVLIYIGIESHSFAIIGDEGINNKVESDFWECTKDLILKHFKNQEYKIGLVKGIINVGEKLKAFFPYQNNDIDELSNEISRG